ncbi:hypothetical protein, partial [Tenacibaculum halocynthiae]|uniref:hypothetical protein n=1 Tax=Tenacibaculum halocynthiae TaxID=1254437 RepID=UPI003D661AE7
ASLSHFKDIAKYEGPALTLAGIVTVVQHRVSKAGKAWASYIVEDYNDRFEFRVFGEQYLKLKHFLIPNSFLFVKT